MQKFSQPKVPKQDKKFVDEREVREIIASALANWTGVTRFRTLETTVVSTTDFTNSQHNHENAAGGGQIDKDAISGQIDVPHGGTGLATITNNAVVIGQGAGNLSTITGKAGTGSFFVAATSGGSPTVQVDYDRGIITAITIT